ncbi:WD repeat-containing protein 54 [Phytophthora cinnamomi]|uniref:WD repeat-containing protein 54 n=1 Tax=Phytophthora cinnamomi TaxID=4785 RepID=UPI00355943E2|nr:WD repeat-containing protein 54 [Phytophthora cinnamomi]
MATSWFVDPELKPTTYTASYVCNNLSKHGDMMAYASVDDVVYVDTTHTPFLTHKLPCAEKSAVHQVRFCTLKELVVIVVASDNGIQGISSVHMKEPRLVVGTSIGKLLVIGKEEDAKAGEGSGFEVCKTLTGHDEPICCVESSLDGNLLASSDMSGAILIHNPIDGFEITHRIVSKGYPATSMTFMAENWLVAGFLTGYLRLYNPETFRVHAEVAAHTRAITALDAHNEFAVSVSEDTFMNVWEISSSKPGAGPRVKLVSSQAVPNDLLTGVVFASMNNLFTATYDTAHLKFWSPE